MSGWLQRLIEGQGGLGIASLAMPLPAAVLAVRGRQEASNILRIALDLNCDGGRSMPSLLAKDEVRAAVEQQVGEARSTLSVIIDIIMAYLDGDEVDERTTAPPVLRPNHL